MQARIKNGCTGCRYCMPCPKGVNIPGNFAIWNEYGVYDNKDTFLRKVNQQIENETFITNCIKCGKCELACPQHLAIRNDFAKLMADIKLIK